MRSPTLPPEILTQIFKHVDPTRDLLSCCLVQSMWCDCALPLIERAPTELLLDPHEMPRLRRTASLITEAAVTAPRVLHAIRGVTVNLDYLFDYLPDGRCVLDTAASDTLVSILLPLSSLQDLHLSRPNHTHHIQVLRPFLQQLSSLGATLTHTSITNCGHPHTPDDDPSHPVADFLLTFSQLTSLTLTHLVAGDSMARSLFQLHKLHSLYLYDVSFPTPTHPLRIPLTRWRHLNTLHIQHPDPFLQTLTTLAVACPITLCHLYIVAPPHSYDVVNPAVHLLLQRLPALRTLALIGFATLAHLDVLSPLFCNCPQLELLDLTDCSSLPDHSMPLTSLWPYLRALRISGCTAMNGELVLEVLSRCERLEEVELTMHVGCHLPVSAALKRRGFMFDGEERPPMGSGWRWKRE
ncbi:hypothetical protein BC938DRAFT_475956 [Jimgerdemannia flammicorona]|uniref:F-box domain-containing protein n=1 Tax=Jimgerdemannia flammicorona TaxID=994334 RepID=A0A433PLT0_9FUNG|nr:hypothetical protein BC938DRAFT_475956 [Jimgerdemannia flammicorona]